ncbi:MAG TPA: DUF4249 domain-containing protein [Flavobacteriales bacterium]|jgi:hypothetical protein
MKTLTNKFSFIACMLGLLTFTMQSCQDVIDVDLNDADPKYVIEGHIYEGVDSIMVRVTQTASFFDGGLPPVVDDATVIITMPSGEEVLLQSIGNGYYKATNQVIVDDADYALRVLVNDEEFTAVTRMPKHIELDSLEQVANPQLFGSDPTYAVYVRYQDPVGPQYYKYVVTYNDTLLIDSDEIIVVDPGALDGQEIYMPIYYLSCEVGDVVEVELQCIDKGVYQFFDTMKDIAGGSAGSPFSATPANPITNIRGGALGVFGAYTSSKKSITITE